MTGRELIVYIMENGLEDEPIFKDGKFVGYMTIEEAAIHLGVGVETVKIWTLLYNLYDYIKVGDVIYIPVDAQTPLEMFKNNERG